MEANGADIRKAAHTVHYLYFKSLEAANSAADDLPRRRIPGPPRASHAVTFHLEAMVRS
jgi:hypothetical protein